MFADYLHEEKYTPVTEVKHVDKLFDEFLKVCFRCKSENEKHIIKKAYDLVKQAFGLRKRRSGDLFIYHSFEVGRIVGIDIGLDYEAVAAAILHDIVAETDITIDDIEFIFGQNIANLVDSLTKIKGTSKYFNEQRAEDYKQMLSSISDVRTIFIKIADRLHNMRTIFALSEEYVQRVAKETLFVYVPFAEILGLFNIKTELEDRAFKVLNPEKFNLIAEHIKTTGRKSIIFLNRISLPVIKKLLDEGFDFSIHSRQKGVYSIFKKMERKKVSLDDIYDIFAIRIIIRPQKDEKEECYKVEKIITSIYPETIPERRRDWIKNPKNDYEALHITVKALGRWVEVQIRSQRMHDIAEHGVAAHYKYKGVSIEKVNFSEKLKVLTEKIKNIATDLSAADESFFNVFESKEIIVYTRKGAPIKVPRGSTALDFAFFINTELAAKFIGVKINGQLEQPGYVLKPGDRVEIITYDKKEPSADLLKYITIPKFKQRYILLLRQKEDTKKGQKIFKNLLLRNNIKENEGQKILKQLIKKYNLKYDFELFILLAKDEKFVEEVDKYLHEKIQSFFGLILGKKRFSDIEIASCCNPRPNDEVIYVKEGNKVIIHKTTCEEVKKILPHKKFKPEIFELDRFRSDATFVSIELRSEDRFGLLYDLANIFYKELGLNLKKFCLTTEKNFTETDKKLNHPQNFVAGVIEFYIKDTKDLKTIEEKLKKLEGVYFLNIIIDEDKE